MFWSQWNVGVLVFFSDDCLFFEHNLIWCQGRYCFFDFIMKSILCFSNINILCMICECECKTAVFDAIWQHWRSQIFFLVSPSLSSYMALYPGAMMIKTLQPLECKCRRYSSCMAHSAIARWRHVFKVMSTIVCLQKVRMCRESKVLTEKALRHIFKLWGIFSRSRASAEEALDLLTFTKTSGLQSELLILSALELLVCALCLCPVYGSHRSSEK